MHPFADAAFVIAAMLISVDCIALFMVLAFRTRRGEHPYRNRRLR